MDRRNGSSIVDPNNYIPIKKEARMFTFENLSSREYAMKKLTLPLYAVLSLGFVGVALAQEDRPSHRIVVCHNGSTYEDTVSEGPLAFLIAISEKGQAVNKHKANHGDCVDGDISIGLEMSEVCELVDGQPDCKEVIPCSCNASP
jgi:hypothetical protein